MTRPSVRRLLVPGLVALLLVAAGVAACNSGGASAPAPAPAPSPAPAYPPGAAPQPGAPASPVAAQIQHGAGVYAQSCAVCHGAAGQGSAQAPPLIGPGALPSQPPAGRRMRTGPFHTAKDLGMFIKDTMPPGGPHLPPTEVAAVLAWLLQSNGVTPTAVVNPSTAGSIPLRR